MSNPRRSDRRWARWIAALALGLGLGASMAPTDAAADPRHRRTHAPSAATRPTRAKAHGRAEPVAVRKRGPLPPPALDRVAIGTGITGLTDETPAPRTTTTAAAAAAAAIDRILRGSLRRGTTSLYVVDADSGRELFSLRPDERMNPASNVKMISMATALDLLGADFRYPTRLLGASPDPAGVVTGDVYLHGSYDPTLAASGLEDLAAQVAASGVKTITGDVLVGAVATRDGLYRSKIGVDVIAGAPGAPPRVAITPAYDFVEVKNEATTGKRPKVKGHIAITSELVTRDDGTKRLVITVKGIVGKGRHVEQAMFTKERALHAAHLLRAALRRAGVDVQGDVAVRELPAYVDGLATGGRLPIALGEHRSAPLGDIVALVDKRSINWLADRVIATASLMGADQTPSVQTGVEAMYAWLDRKAGIHHGDVFVDSGSGLSHRTMLSTRQLVSVLRTAGGMTGPKDDDERAAACAKAFTHSLSVAGVDGTLRARFRGDGLRGRIIGKTGTLRDAIALSGVLTGAGDRRIVFSLVTNGHDPSRKRSVRAAHEAVLEVLDHYLAAAAAASPSPSPEAAPAAEPVVAADDAPTDPALVHDESDEDSSSPDDDQPEN